MVVYNLISASSDFSKSSLNIWKFMVHVLLKPGMENFEHYFASMWDERICAVVWTFFGIAFLWDWNENWPDSFPHGWVGKNLPAMRETRVGSLGWEDPLEEEMATHSSTLAWRLLWTEEPGGLLSMGSHRVGHDWSDLACMHALEKKMATYSSVLAWRIPGTEETGGLPSMGSHRVGRDWINLAAAAAFDTGFLLWSL